jgi:hypothetical protein
MDNHGKLWTIDQDQRLMEAPHLSNGYFSQIMGRSENAIKCRRSHIAAKMHLDDPGTPLEEYVGLMGGELIHAQTLIVEWNKKRASLRSFVDRNRKRRQDEISRPASPPPAQKTQSRFFSAGQEPQQASSSAWIGSTPDERITAICESIRGENGNLSSVFNDPQLLPTIIQHYPGFEAYSRVVQARLNL